MTKKSKKTQENCISWCGFGAVTVVKLKNNGQIVSCTIDEEKRVSKFSGGGFYMTEKELKKLSRMELLEMLIEQTKRADLLQKKLDEANKKLEERAIIMENAGSIAEASMQLSGVFEAAQRAADLYMENVRRLEMRRRSSEQSRMTSAAKKEVAKNEEKEEA